MEGMSASFRSRTPYVTVLLIFALAGCAQESGPSPVGTDAPVIVPHGPGTPARTATPGERIAGPSSEPVAADVRFAEAMIPHHRQALEMTGLVADRTTNPAVRRIADQIALAQKPEIEVMATWLSRLGRAVPGEHTHGLTGYGMASLAEMNGLRAARGVAFDREFLRLMIRHHEGALTMATEVLKGGKDMRMRMLARDVYSGQSIEIARMRPQLDALS